MPKYLKEIPPSNEVEKRFRKRLLALTAALKAAIQKEVVPLFTKFDPLKTFTDYTKAIGRIRKRADEMTETYEDLSATFSMDAYRTDTRKHKSALKLAYPREDKTGINLLEIISDEGLEEQLAAMTQSNVQLIKSIPTQYLDNVNQIIQQAWLGKMPEDVNLHKEIAKQVKGKLEVNDRRVVARAKLIARDQTSKLNSVFTQIRAQNMGSEEYIWRNMKDKRVRGNPSGLYPYAKYDHWDYGGQTFRWDNPPDGGHPGTAVNCRCYARVILPLIEDLRKRVAAKT